MIHSRVPQGVRSSRGPRGAHIDVDSDEGHMTELPTAEATSLRSRSSSLVLILISFASFISPIAAIRNWTDVKIAAALVAVVCLRRSRTSVLVACSALIAGHSILGAFASVGGWPLAAWVVVGFCAAFDALVLMFLLEAMTAASDVRLPSVRILRFLGGAGVLAIGSGVVESWLVSLTQARNATPTGHVVFGLAVAACLAAIAVTRRGSQWFSSDRQPGAELLAPLLVVLVTLVAVQVTRQVWIRHDVDRLEFVTGTSGTSSMAQWAVLGIEAAVGALLFAVLVLGANSQFKMTQERRRRENLLEAALDATPGTSVVFGSDYRVLAANRPVREQFPERIPGLEVWTIFGLEGNSGRQRLVEDVLRSALEGRPAQIEIAEDPGEDSDAPAPGRMRIIELSAYPVTSPGGEPIGFLHSVDATERRSLAMRSAQSERMESLGALAGGLAHDFNNLLFVTLGNLQLMAMNETVTRDEKLSKFLSRSMSAVERGAEITKSLLAVARSQPLEESAVSLADLVKGILPLVRQALGSGRRVEVDIPDPSLLLMVDSGRLSSCILNLAFNARDAMGPNGTLRIRARLDEESDMIELSVSDDGAGMPPEVVARAFEPFFTTKSAGSGTGLGLATVYAFAKQSGGTAYLESSIGAGTSVTLVLPRFTGEAPSQEVVAARRSGRRVVVADDEQSLAEMVAAWLIDMGVDARFATSPKSALELIESLEPDVLVSDANFGEELDGIELARLGTAIVPDMAVVFMTGYSSSMRELQELGERTLAKPFSREDLYAALSPLIAEEDSEVPSTGSKRKKGRTS